MSGNHSGVKCSFQESAPRFTYIHCRNYRLAFCFAHLILPNNNFKNFDAFPLNLYLLSKNISVKQATFEEVQNAYLLTSIILKKATVTR